MALVTFSPLISDIRGKTADAVFASWKGRNYVRQRVVPANPQSVAQTAVRDSLAEAVAIWQQLPAALQTGYGNAAANLNISGYNDFVGRNRKVIQNQTQLYGPRRNTDAVLPRIEIPTDFAYDSEPGVGTARYTWTDPGQGVDYRMGFVIYDTTANLAGDINVNANLMSAEAQVLSHPTVGNTYLTAVWVYRVSDAEMVHFGGTSHVQLT